MCTRFDIAYAVSMLGRFLFNARIVLWKAAKEGDERICIARKIQLKNFKTVMTFVFVDIHSLIFTKCADDMNHAAEVGLYLQLFQLCVEFVACYEATIQAVWLRNFIPVLQLVNASFETINIFFDNFSMVFYSKNNKTSIGSNHIDIKYLVIRCKVKMK